MPKAPETQHVLSSTFEIVYFLTIHRNNVISIHHMFAYSLNNPLLISSTIENDEVN